MRNFWQHEFPVGDPNRGPAFGERTDPVSIGVALVGAEAVGGAAATAGLIGSGGALTAGGVLSGIGALGAVSSLVGGKEKPGAPAPMVSKPTVMPTPDDEAARLAKRKSLAMQAQRRGRQSTILSDDSSGDLLG